jgi:flagellar biosynthesis protein FlhF
MKLKVFIANNRAEAFEMVKTELGEQALITDTEYFEDGRVRITAALEDDVFDNDIYEAFTGTHNNSTVNIIRDALEYHNVPFDLADSIIKVANLAETDDTVMALASAIDDLFRFNPLPETKTPMAFMLVGPPGAGKTLSVAKLAAKALMKKKLNVGVITTDVRKPGAIEQLSLLMKILNIETLRAKTPTSLLKTIDILRNEGKDLILIDSPAHNPFALQDMSILGDYIGVTNIEPVLVMPAGIDPIEAEEIAESFVDVGTNRIIATKLDVSRRLGAILNAAKNHRLNFSNVGATPNIAKGIFRINPVSMARLILPED